jgi:SAM-dependent methyltransferase
MHNAAEVLDYWNRDEVESMYDKHLITLEIDLIRTRIACLAPNPRILDAGCGEGEGTLVYSAIPGAVVHGVDFADTRLRKAAERLGSRPNVLLSKVDFLEPHALGSDYDVVISQRFLINLMDWDLQQRVLKDLMARLKPGGRLMMLEGSRNGVDALNGFRALLGLEPLPIKWHNLFFDDQALASFMCGEGLTLEETTGPGSYFLLTRGIRPALDRTLNWDSSFNERAASPAVAEALGVGATFSRLKLWVFRK